jgi:exodeoxyribonuclease V alpha subunit
MCCHSDPNQMNATIPERKAITEEISGLIERVTFHNDENGFCVLRVKVRGQRDEVTVLGSLPSVTAGEWLEAEGWWVRDKEHGLQFKTKLMKTVPPTTVEGIERYLSSGLVKGIGPVLAKKLVARFGAEVLEVIEARVTELQSVDGIGPKRQERIAHAWKEAKQVRQIMLFLHSHGVNTSRAVRIFKTYGEQAVEKVRSNPYMLYSERHLKTSMESASRRRIRSRRSSGFRETLSIGPGRALTTSCWKQPQTDTVRCHSPSSN